MRADTRSSASARIPAVPRAAGIRPVARETTLSFINRLALRCRIGIHDIAAELVQDEPGQSVLKGLRMDGEVYLNAAARSRLAAFCRTPEAVLGRALPAFRALEPASALGPGRPGSSASERWSPQSGSGAVSARPHAPAPPGRSAATCPPTRASASGTATGCWAPTASTALLWPSSRSTSPPPPRSSGRSAGTCRLLRQCPEGAAAFTLAQAVVHSSSARKQWPEEEAVAARSVGLGSGAEVDPGGGASWSARRSPTPKRCPWPPC